MMRIAESSSGLSSRIGNSISWRNVSISSLKPVLSGISVLDSISSCSSSSSCDSMSSKLKCTNSRGGGLSLFCSMSSCKVSGRGSSFVLSGCVGLDSVFCVLAMLKSFIVESLESSFVCICGFVSMSVGREKNAFVRSQKCFNFSVFLCNFSF